MSPTRKEKSPVHRAGGGSEVSSSEMKKSWHRYLDRVDQTNEEIVITRYGRPVARLVPFHGEGGEGGIFGCLAGTVTIHGDIIAPTGEAWEADG